MKIFAFVLLALTLAGAADVSGQVQEVAFPIVGDDGFELEGLLARPAGGDVQKLIILLHGSGPQSMDADLTALTTGGRENLFFRDLSDTLAAEGYAVLRYHKRSYQTNLRAQADPSFLASDTYQAYAENPLKYFVDDALAAVRQVHDRFPGVRVYLLGHSQGTYVALQAAAQGAELSGIALIGFHVTTTDMLLHEQTVYRPLSLFEDLDGDANGMLDQDELAADSPIAASIRAQMGILDLDGDSALAQAELMAGNMSNLVMRDMAGILRSQEAEYPRPADILAGLDIDVAFFHGLWDNQTPAYQTMAVEIVARHVWGKDNFHFHYFPQLGHALDVRSNYGDLQYGTIDPGAKAALARELKALF